MSTLTDTDLVAFSSKEYLYLYFQQETSIKEFSSPDGELWLPGATLAKDELDPNGSPITGYYVLNDGSNDDKPTIHLFYLNAKGRLCELTRATEGNEWKVSDLPDDIATAPVNTSKLSSGVCHDDPQSKSHQWVYFTQENKDKGMFEMAEIRRGGPDYTWVYRKVLPDKGQAALPGTAIAANITDAVNYLYFQDHAGNIMQYKGGYEKWDSGEVVIKAGAAVINTPLATTPGAVSGPHMFSAAKEAEFVVQDFAGDTNVRVTSWMPGSRLGASTFKDIVYLFYKDSAKPLAISAMFYKGGEWARGHNVVG